ncbi:site-specific integrase [Aliarcobacter cryaerophilus]|uniref:tyrosine-type recombinase/integrase n=1 Tax=Aliarcobacter cryaerophilus TaxID=28198 RepID=UPI0021B6044C|nr:site-specific integrase [Aliarcobacter cryaerophilus]MCT7539164.1 site-specific integrase [Aliarcobacter cryaerophilus]
MSFTPLGGKYAGVYIKSLQNGDESYAIAYRDEKSNSVRKTIGRKSEGMTKSKAIAILNDVKIRIRKSEESEIQVSSKTLNELADKYFEDKILSKRSMSKEISRYNKHIRTQLWANNETRKITKKQLTKLFHQMIDEGYALATIEKNFTLCRAIINYAIQNRYYFGRNEFTHLELPKYDNKRTRFLSQLEIGKLLTRLELEGDSNSLLLTILALNTGARKETLLNIKYKDINFNTGEVKLYDFKYDEYYQGLIADKEVLRRLHDLSFSNDDNNYILYSKTPKNKLKEIPRPLKRALDELFNSNLEPLDLDRVYFHTFRHTFASLLVQKGVGIYLVKKLMNHHSIHSTMRYAKFSPDNGLKEVQELWNNQETRNQAISYIENVKNRNKLN